MRIFCLVLLTFLCFGCGQESLENILRPLTVPVEDDMNSVIAVPLSVQQALFNRSGTRERLKQRLLDLEEDSPDWERWMDQYVASMCLQEEQYTYYNRYIDAGGIAIIGNEIVSDEFFIAARDIILEMTSKRTELREILTPEKSRFRMVLLPPATVVVSRELPEDRTLALSLTPGSCSAGGLCFAMVQHHLDMRLFVHEFAHAIHFAIVGEFINTEPLDTDFDSRLKFAYETAIAENKWQGDYAEENYREYWAEGVKLYYYLVTDNGRVFEDLQAFAEYDPLLFELISKWFSISDFSGRY